MKESIWFYLELVGFPMFQIYYFISKKISLEFCFEQIHEFAPLVLKSSSIAIIYGLDPDKYLVCPYRLISVPA